MPFVAQLNIKLDGIVEHQSVLIVMDPTMLDQKIVLFYQYNTELKLLMTRSGLNVHEARRELYIRGIKDHAQSNTYSFVSKPGSSTEISKKDQGQSSSKVKSQTLLHNKNDNTTVSPNEHSVVIPEKHFKTCYFQNKININILT